MTTHRLVEQDRDPYGPTYAYCSCGARILIQEGWTERGTFERHRALSRGRTRQPRPK